MTNADLSALLGEDIDGFVSTVLGIRERRVCGPSESTADLAEAAARGTLAARGVARTTSICSLSRRTRRSSSRRPLHPYCTAGSGSDARARST